jgi:hypothetical protein
MYLYNGVKLKVPVLINGVNYSLNYLDSLDTTQLTALNVTKVADPVLPDPNLFDYVENADGTLTVTAKTTAEMDVIRANVWNSIQAMRDQHRFGGVLVGTNWFKSDPDNRTEIEGMLLLGASLPGGQSMTSMADVEVPLTQTLVQQIFQALLVCDVTNFAVAKNHHAALLASSNPAIYDYSAGWAAIYVG